MTLISSSLSKCLDTYEDISAYSIFFSSRMGTDGYKFVTPNETRIALDGMVVFFIFSARVMEFLTEYWERTLILSGRVFVSHLLKVA